VPIQIDNTRPKIKLSGDLECQTFHCKDIPLKVKGAIYDKHFSHYRLTFRKFGMSSHQFAQGNYNDPVPLCGTGTVGATENIDLSPVVLLGSLDIADKLGIPCKKVEGGRYTVFLYAYPTDKHR
jgi:hypothetical protein